MSRSASRLPFATSPATASTCRRFVTPPDAAVQWMVGSPGWIAFGDNGGGDRIAVDLTPGPRGHTGQIIILSHEENIGAGRAVEMAPMPSGYDIW